MHVKGVLLDIDGTLLLSNDANADAWVRAAAEHDVVVDRDQVRARQGMGGELLLPAVSDVTADSETGRRISKRRSELTREHLSEVKPAPGSRRLVETLHEHGLATMVCTSAQGEDLRAMLVAAEVDDLLTEAATADDVEDAKPAPDLVLAGLDRLKLPPEKVFMLGDSPYDISAARKAGVALVAVRCGGFSDDRLEGAAAIYDDPGDVADHWDALMTTLERSA